MIADMGQPDSITTIDHQTSNTKRLLSNSLMINVVGQTDLTTTINHHTSTTKGLSTIKGLLSKSLMINKMGKNIFHHNNWSQNINYERTIVKISIVEIVPKKIKCKTGDTILAAITQVKMQNM